MNVLLENVEEVKEVVVRDSEISGFASKQGSGV